MGNTQPKGYEIDQKKSALRLLKKNSDDLDEYVEFKYIYKKQINHDTFIYIYELPEKTVLGINPGEHIIIKAMINDEEVTRKYTPISNSFVEGKFELLVKVYFPNVHPKFPQGGKMTQYLNNLEIGQNISCQGPRGKLQYLGNGLVKIQKKADEYTQKKYNRFGMIAGGSGITPIYQILQAAYQNSDKTTEFTLIFGNKTTSDIILRDELLTLSFHINLNLKFLIDQKEENWEGLVGYVSKEMLEKELPGPSEDTMILMCGPPIMTDLSRKFLKEIGHNLDNVFKF